MELGLIDNRIGPIHVLLVHKEYREVKGQCYKFTISSKNKVKGLPRISLVEVARKNMIV